MTPSAVRLAALLVAVLVLGPARASHGSAGDEPLPEHEWVAELLAEATSDDEVASFAATIELAPLLDWIPVDDALALWQQVANGAPRGDVQAWARYAALRTARSTAEDGVADRLEQALGFVDSFAVIGPFPNDGMEGLVTPYGPELDGFVPGAAYAGRVEEVAWRSFDGVAETGYVDLRDLVQPAQNAVAYVAFVVEVPRSTVAVLDLAVDGAYRLWCNGVPVAEQGESLGGALLRDAHPIRLRAGANPVLLKVAVTDGGFGFHARLLDRRGEALEATVSAPIGAGGAVREQDDWPAAPTAAARVAVDAGDVESAGASALVLRTLQPDDPAEPWVPLAAIVEADPAASAPALIRAASTLREHWRRVVLLERARSAGGRAALAWSLAHLEELGVGPLDQVRTLNAGTERLPGALRLEFARVARAVGFTHVWAAEVDALRADYGDVPALIHELLAVSRELARGSEETALLRTRWEQSRLDAGALEEWLARARLLGDTAAIDEALRDVSQRAPSRRAMQMAVARHLAAAGALREAVAQLDTLLEQCPGDADAWIERARVSLRAGDDEAAVMSLEQALVRRRQDEGARQLLAALQPGVEAGYATWRVSRDALVAEAAALQPGDGVDRTVLLDQRVVDVFPNGLATRWTQQAYVAHTRRAADDLGSLGIPYSPGSEVVDILSVEVIAPDGTVRSAYEQADYGPQPGPAAMYFDVHTRALRFPAIEPGDVLVYEYRVSDVAERNIFDDYFGDIFVVQGEAPVELARYVVTMPAGRTLHVASVPSTYGEWSDETDGDGRTTYRFEARDVPRVPWEANRPGWSETRQWLIVSTYSSWDALARWYWSLIERQLVATAPIREAVSELTAGLESEEEIVAAIHEYVVRNVRYVGLEFGVHGYKPYRTSEVFERRFGDCKDTASLMKVMLNAAGIEAYVVLIRTRDQGRVPADPPSLAVFNHAITFVPSLNLYLDGTAGFSGMREVPSMDQGATALHILDGRGGTLVETPFVDAAANVDRTVSHIRLGTEVPEGTIEVELLGAFAASARASWEAEEGREAAIERGLAQRVPGISVTLTDVAGVGSIRESVRVRGAFTGGEWIRRSAEGFAVPVSPGRSGLVGLFAPSSTRVAEVELPSPSTTEERFVWELGEGCTIEQYTPVVLASSFGRLAIRADESDGRWAVETELRIETPRVAPGDYDAFRSWLTAVDTELNREVGVVCASEVTP